MSDYFTNDVLNSLNVNFKYQCQWCDEYLIGFSCTNEKRHVNMMCSHTFTPIEKDYLFCKSCNATARVELYDKNPICVFCDLYLINSDLIT
uniref:Uncharacterized protein n=1 Tax=Pararge aegeria TaxID=116150 RepID=S4NPP9_9NEOP